MSPLAGGVDHRDRLSDALGVRLRDLVTGMRNLNDAGLFHHLVKLTRIPLDVDDLIAVTSDDHTRYLNVGVAVGHLREGVVELRFVGEVCFELLAPHPLSPDEFVIPVRHRLWVERASEILFDHSAANECPPKER